MAEEKELHELESITRQKLEELVAARDALALAHKQRTAERLAMEERERELEAKSRRIVPIVKKK